jgi:hypothetical protein
MLVGVLRKRKFFLQKFSEPQAKKERKKKM